MSGAALGLVLAAALAHASWNLFVKQAGGGGVAFAWLTSAVQAVIYAPVVVVAILVTEPAVGAAEVGLVLGSGVLHTAYFLLLQRGYAAGDLSLVYPVARGLGPLLAVCGAILLLGERPSGLALLGVLAVAGGVLRIGYTSRANPARLDAANPQPPSAAALLYAVATAVMIAGYTLWDGYAMGVLLLSPILYEWGGNLVRLSLLTLLTVRRRSAVRQTWRVARREVVGVAVLAPLAYILALWAFTMAPVSYVAPAREFSIVFGTLLGALVLGERSNVQRIVAAVTITLGVVLLGIA